MNTTTQPEELEQEPMVEHVAEAPKPLRNYEPIIIDDKQNGETLNSRVHRKIIEIHNAKNPIKFYDNHFSECSILIQPNHVMFSRCTFDQCNIIIIESTKEANNIVEIDHSEITASMLNADMITLRIDDTDITTSNIHGTVKDFTICDCKVNQSIIEPHCREAFAAYDCKFDESIVSAVTLKRLNLIRCTKRSRSFIEVCRTGNETCKVEL